MLDYLPKWWYLCTQWQEDVWSIGWEAYELLFGLIFRMFRNYIVRYSKSCYLHSACSCLIKNNLLLKPWQWCFQSIFSFVDCMKIWRPWSITISSAHCPLLLKWGLWQRITTRGVTFSFPIENVRWSIAFVHSVRPQFDFVRSYIWKRLRFVLS